MNATFQFEAAFHIPKHGLALAGIILDGTIYIGSHIALPNGSGGTQTERVTGIEGIRALNEDGSPKPTIGILLGELSEKDVPALKARLLFGTVLELQGPEQKHGP